MQNVPIGKLYKNHNKEIVFGTNGPMNLFCFDKLALKLFLWQFAAEFIKFDKLVPIGDRSSNYDEMEGAFTKTNKVQEITC